jgi:hypothetical protein
VVRRGGEELQGAARAAGGCKGLQGAAGGCKGLQGVLGLEGAPGSVGALDGSRAQPPLALAGRIGLEDVQKVVLTIEHLRVVVHHVNAAPVQPIRPLVHVGGRVLGDELYRRRLAAARRRGHAE